MLFRSTHRAEDVDLDRDEDRRGRALHIRIDQGGEITCVAGGAEVVVGAAVERGVNDDKAFDGGGVMARLEREVVLRPWGRGSARGREGRGTGDAQ